MRIAEHSLPVNLHFVLAVGRQVDVEHSVRLHNQRRLYAHGIRLCGKAVGSMAGGVGEIHKFHDALVSALRQRHRRCLANIGEIGSGKDAYRGTHVEIVGIAFHGAVYVYESLAVKFHSATLLSIDYLHVAPFEL